MEGTGIKVTHTSLDNESFYCFVLAQCSGHRSKSLWCKHMRGTFETVTRLFWTPPLRTNRIVPEKRSATESVQCVAISRSANL